MFAVEDACRGGDRCEVDAGRVEACDCLEGVHGVYGIHIREVIRAKTRGLISLQIASEPQQAALRAVVSHKADGFHRGIH